MKIVIGNDHASVSMKQELTEYLTNLGHEVINVGTDSTNSCDYPVYGVYLCKELLKHENALGIGICGTGIGISLACNKMKGIRACACSDNYSAKMSREHNNANVLCFGSRVIGIETAKMLVDTFINTPYSNEVRHHRRVDLIMEIEEGKYE